MRSSLSDIVLALDGQIGMSNALDELSDALYTGALPPMWRRLAPETKMGLGPWIEHFLRRYAQYKAWVETGEPKVMWMAGLHVPESYLTALVQTACRANGWPLDRSTLYTVVTEFTSRDQITAKPATGCYVDGLFLEGAAWSAEEGHLVPQDPKSLIRELPILQVIPVERHKLKKQNTFSTPVYVTQDRRDSMGVGLVFEADLASAVHDSLWILQGVALVLNPTL